VEITPIKLSGGQACTVLGEIMDGVRSAVWVAISLHAGCRGGAGASCRHRGIVGRRFFVTGFQEAQKEKAIIEFCPVVAQALGLSFGKTEEPYSRTYLSRVQDKNFENGAFLKEKAAPGLLGIGYVPGRR
jgi:hypothetical protein